MLEVNSNKSDEVVNDISMEGSNGMNSNYVEPRKKFPRWIIILIILVVLINIFFLIARLFISSLQVSSTITKARRESFVNNFKAIEKDFKIKVSSGEDVLCSKENCKYKYNYDNSKIDLEVVENGTQIIINYSATKNGMYKDIELTSANCPFKNMIDDINTSMVSGCTKNQIKYIYETTEY